MEWRSKRIIAITGHYGSGKTNLAVNLALDFQSQGEAVTLVDLDIVNPYFRSSDFSAMLSQRGIELIAPVYAGTNLDIPALSARVDAAIAAERTVLLDIGGDDAGAFALGRYSGAIKEAGGCDMLYVINAYRYLTRHAAQADALLGEIERASRMKAVGIVNNSNLGNETTASTVLQSIPYAVECAERCGLPLLFTATDEKYMPDVSERSNEKFYPVKIYVKKPWE